MNSPHSSSNLEEQRKLVAAAYDPQLFREAGNVLIASLHDHLQTVRKGQGSVLNWCSPEETIQYEESAEQEDAISDLRKRLHDDFSHILDDNIGVSLNLDRQENISHEENKENNLNSSELNEAVTILTNIEEKTDFDHRIAMAFCIMGTKLGPLNIKDSDSINTSFPTFKDEFKNLGGNIF